ncbi:MAG: bacterial Ig-like domain-containing protein [Clostridia bacterium]|nr:bacterial Ig-like domain-containing protein [Clostridia bacterium]
MDENGRITASKAGVYTVTVSVKGYDVKASCKVTVS